MKIGSGTKIYPLSNVYCAEIGEHCSVANFVEIGRGVVIGDFCSIQAFAFIPEGVTIGDNVFVGPHVCFTNCLYPSANKKYFEENPKLESIYRDVYDAGKRFIVVPTLVDDDVVIGAGSVILCGITIGKGAIIGAGSVVVKDVKPGEKIIQKRANLTNILVKQPDGRIERL
jgi:acetyltransferase-like isoleucine patch superfamily enzyme